METKGREEEYKVGDLGIKNGVRKNEKANNGSLGIKKGADQKPTTTLNDECLGIKNGEETNITTEKENKVEDNGKNGTRRNYNK